MVLINNLTIDEINAALLHLQRARTEVVGGTKGSTVQNITISNKGGGSTVDYAPTITALSNRIDKNADNIKSVESELDKIQATLEQLSDNGISSMTFDPSTRQLQINTQDGEVYSCDITSESISLDFDATTNKLTLYMGAQVQEVTLPYINANEKGSANGVATLDSSGRVPYSQLPESAMEFLGQWDASTNTPHLADGTGTNGDFYIVSAGGTVDFGTAQNPRVVTFSVNDRVVYEGDIAQWVRLPAGQVSSVNGQSGAVTLTASDIEYSTGVSIKAKIDANAVQADWNVTDTTSLAYIKNKPTIPSTPTLVCCAKCVYLDTYTGNADRPIMVTSGRGTTGYNNQGVVTSGCDFTYNPATGYLKLKSNGKIACIVHMNSTSLHIYTDACCIAFNKSIYIPVGCCYTFNGGANPVAGLCCTCGYWGMTGPRAETNVWIRTTSCGIIPYQSGEYNNGHNYLGTSTWYFRYGYIQEIYSKDIHACCFCGNLCGIASCTPYLYGACENNVSINWRSSCANHYTTTSYQTAGSEALVFATKCDETSFMFVNGEDSVTNHASDRWQLLTPGLQIKNNKVSINKLIASGTAPIYELEVNGTVCATCFRGNMTVSNAFCAACVGATEYGGNYGHCWVIPFFTPPTPNIGYAEMYFDRLGFYLCCAQGNTYLCFKGNLCAGCGIYGGAIHAPIALSTLCAKWCLVCKPGGEIRYLRMAYCSNVAGTYIAIPTSSFWYCTTCYGCYPVPEVVTLSANTWTLTGYCYLSNGCYYTSTKAICGIPLAT